MSCDVKNCRRESILQYEAFGPGREKKVGVCELHWAKDCDEEDKFNLVKHFYPPQVAKKGR